MLISTQNQPSQNSPRLLWHGGVEMTHTPNPQGQELWAKENTRRKRNVSSYSHETSGELCQGHWIEPCFHSHTTHVNSLVTNSCRWTLIIASPSKSSHPLSSPPQYLYLPHAMGQTNVPGCLRSKVPRYIFCSFHSLEHVYLNKGRHFSGGKQAAQKLVSA